MVERPSRKLAVILHADVVGSTTLVQQNETLAHGRIRDVYIRFSELIKSYGGITHELRGDALVAEFERASDAVTAGLAFQAKNSEYNATLDDGIRPRIRIGVSMGEVVIADRTVTGPGVVLAQRLEELAEPSGICIQGAAYETVPRRLPFDYEYLGEQKVKGFEEPVRVYAVTLKEGEAIPAPEPRKQIKQDWMVRGGIALFVVFAGGLLWSQPWIAREKLASSEPESSVIGEAPSTAVLPSGNLTGAPQRERRAITAIIDAAGDGDGNLLDDPTDIAVDHNGNVYVPGHQSDNAFRITPAGKITQIIDAAGDAAGKTLSEPHGIVVDGAGNVFVSTIVSNNVFRISTPAGKISEIIDATGDGAGNALNSVCCVAVDGYGNAYVTGYATDNAFQITPAGIITEIINEAGDGAGNPLDGATGVVADDVGNIYVAGYASDNVFRIESGHKVTEIIDATGDGAGNLLDGPSRLAVDGAGTVYVNGFDSDNVFRITSAGKITEIIDALGDGSGNPLDGPGRVAVDGAGNVYVTGVHSDNAFQITLAGTITEIINASGDGAGQHLDRPVGIVVDEIGNVYLSGRFSDNAFRVIPGMLDENP